MNGKTLHAVSGLSAKATIRLGLSSIGIKDDVVHFPLDLSTGYIPKDFSDKELCFALASYNRFDYCINEFDDLKNFVTTDYSAYDKIIVWHGWSAYDLLFLYFMSTLVDGKLYQIDIRDCHTFMERELSEDKPRQYPDMGSVSPDDVTQMVSLAKPISDAEKQYYKEQWLRWSHSLAPYRLSNIHTGIIKEYPADFMDAAIIEEAKNSPSLFRVVSKVMNRYDDFLYLNDAMVYRRIMELRNEGVLDFTVSIKNKS